MAVVAWDGLDDGVYGVPYAMKYGDNQLRRRIGTLFAHRAERADQGLLAALLGAAAGGTATKTHAEITAPVDSTQIGGKRVVATVNDINRVTTTADTAALNANFVTSRALTYPGDKSGNGK